MEYRVMRQDEVQAYMDAEAYCFNAPADIFVPYVEHKFRAEYGRGMYSSEGVMKVAMTHWPFEVYMHGAKLGMGGVAGVVSWPEYRRGGLVGEMLCRYIAELKEQGVPLTSLYPFKQSFYRQYGYEVAGAWVQHDIPVELLAPYRKAATGTVQRFAPNTADWRTLAQIYQAYAADRRGYMVREAEEHWTGWITQPWSILNPQPHVALWRPAPGAEPQGYLLYRFHKGSDEKFILIARELVALTAEAATGLWGYIAQHDSQVKAVQIRLPREYPLWHLAENTYEIKSELKSGWMLRFVDVKDAFEQTPWPDAPNGALTIGVRDAQAPWNDGAWRLAFEGGGATVTSAHAETPDLSTDIGTWSALYAGIFSAAAAAGSGRLACSDPKALRLLTQALAGPEMWFYEYF